MSDTTTRGVRIQVESRFLPERSNAQTEKFVFAYTVTISNESDATVQLISRRWVITDGDNDVETVEGPGVVGEQPVLMPGQSFEYTSYCPLATPFGTMEGHYVMMTASGERFPAKISPFGLATPGALN